MRNSSIYFKLFFAVLFCIPVFNLNAQLPKHEWAKQLGPAHNGLGEPKSIVADKDGNIYVTGVFSGTNDFDPGPQVLNLTAVGGSDIFILKLNPFGNLIWVKQLSGTVQDDIANSISLDPAGNIFVSGYFYGTIDFDPGPGTFNLASSNTFSNAFILKLNADGDFLWAKQIAGNSFNGSFSITTSGTDILLAGVFSEMVDFDPGASVFNLISVSVADNFILKLNNQGEFIWVKQIGGSSAPSPRSIKTDKDSNVICAGYFIGTIDFDPGAGINELSSDIDYSGFILKLNPNGNFIWAKNFAGDGNVYIRGTAVSKSGKIFTTGTFENTADFNPGTESYNLTTQSETGFIAALDDDGSFQWAKSSPDKLSCVSVDTTGNVCAGGQALAGHAITKWSNAGDSLWRINLGTALNSCNTIFLDRNSNIYSAGYFTNETDFDPGDGVDKLTASPEPEMYIHKLSQIKPVLFSFISVSADAALNMNIVNWVVNDAIIKSSGHFEIQRSSDGALFTTIGTIEESDIAAYAYYDFLATSGTNYYQIIFVPNQNQVVSQIASVTNIINTNSQLAIWPNPVSTDVTVASKINFINASARVFDAKGRLVMTIDNLNGNVFTLSCSKLSAGVYFIRIDNNGTRLSARIFKL